ncbi:hypothetical protein BH24ACT5_BH24ACT5_28490 [soil metagenome]
MSESVDYGPPDWGSTWLLAFVAAAGLLVVTIGDAASRSGRFDGHALFWLGILLIILPIVWRVLINGVSRSERLALVVTAGLCLYAVKVVRDPFAFTFADEFVHQHNTNEVLRTGSLFGDNSILPITPYYPGLPTATATVAALTGLSTFAAGLVVVGSARLIATIALFLLIETLLHSDRAAAAGVLAYVSVPNYLYFSAQFAYESLALPLAMLFMAAVARREHAADDCESKTWTALAVGIAPAVVMTHHLTSYALLATLIAISALSRAVRWVAMRRTPPESVPSKVGGSAPVALTVTLATMVIGWLVLAGRRTAGYLSPVVNEAIAQTWGVLAQEAPPRALFQSTAETDAGNAVVAPTWERLAGLGSVAVLVVWIPLGLLALRRRHEWSPTLLLLAVAAVAYLGTFPLRFVPAAWETAARASEFLFIVVAAIVAATLALAGQSERWLRRLIATAAVGVLVTGGAVAGWPTDRRLAAPYRLRVGDTTIEPEVIAFGRWSAVALPHGQRIASEQSDARVLQLYGGHYAVAGRNPDVQDILHLPTFDDWMYELLREQRFRYVAVDRRLVSADNMAGYFFAPEGSPGAADRAPEMQIKFDRVGAERVFDSGDIVLFDMEAALINAPTVRVPSR